LWTVSTLLSAVDKERLSAPRNCQCRLLVEVVIRSLPNIELIGVVGVANGGEGSKSGKSPTGAEPGGDEAVSVM
jgi:hypothetical protein